MAVLDVLLELGEGRGSGGGRGNNDIATWVAANGTPTTIGTQTIYDLRA